VINFKSVTKRFGAETAAVHDFSLQVPTGKITVLMGSSGCGKTTLLRMVNRMVEPDSGQVLVNGNDVATLQPVRLRRSIGYVMQESGLLPHKSVLENVALVAKISGQEKAEALTNAAEMLELVGIEPSQFRRYPSQLSGGQQQRVGVARALAVKPKILLMDEPFGAVDPIVREELQLELKRIQQTLGLTILFVTHDRYEAMHLADQLVVLTKGATIEQRGTPEEIAKAPKSAFVQKILGLGR
jgi:osmoprotectant transport system ATP-binding protein